MNGWRAVGYVFSVLGFVFLTVATIVGLPVLGSINLLDQFSSETFLGLFIAAILPYVLLATVMFVVAACGFYAGRSRRVDRVKVSGYSRSAPRRRSPPHPHVSSCPSCGQPVVFFAQYQRWYCPQEEKYV